MGPTITLEDAVVIALGANLDGPHGRPVETLDHALARIEAEGFEVLARSRWWRSEAWPDPSEPAYINGVALVKTRLSPAEALAALHRTEAELGRVRSRPNAPRVLDLDLIAFGRLVDTTPGLTLPHPRAAERFFVMGPLAEIAPAWRHPVNGATAVELAAEAPVGRDAAPLIS